MVLEIGILSTEKENLMDVLEISGEIEVCRCCVGQVSTVESRDVGRWPHRGAMLLRLAVLCTYMVHTYAYAVG